MMAFFDCRSPLFVDFLERGATINAKRYADTLQKLRCTLECYRTESSFCMITPVPMLAIWWGISFRDLTRKHFNILRTAQFFPLVTSKFLATWRKTFMDVCFIRTRKCKSGWGCGSISDLPLSTRLELFVFSPSGINVLTLLAITFH